MSTNTIRVIVVDDQAIVRQGFAALVNTVPDMAVIAEGTNGRQAVDLYRQHRPDVVLMDLRMPIMGGVEAITAIRQEFPGARIIVLTTYDGDEDIYRSLQAGAQGYLLKDVFFDELEQHPRQARRDGPYASRDHRSPARNRPPAVARHSRVAAELGGPSATRE